jgi:hypothetical protein
MAIRSTSEGVIVENSFHILKVDFVVTQVAIAFLRIPVEGTNA